MKDLLRPLTLIGNRRKSNLLHLVFLILLIWQLGAPSPAQSQGAPEARVTPVPTEGAAAARIPPDLSKKNVLILHAYTYETASSLIMDPIYVKEFVDAGLGRFNLHFEFMDLAKYPGPEHRRELVKFLGRKFEKQPIDLIIALHSPALNFLIEEGRNLFPGVPVINVIATSEFLSNEDIRATHERRIRPLKRPFVILPYATHVESTVKGIISLNPDTRTLVVISGSGFLDIIMEQAVRRSLQAWQERLSVEYLEALPLDKLLKRLPTLAPKTPILFVNFSADPDGRAYSPPEVVRRISRAAEGPVFGLFDTLLEKGGIVGGVMPTFRGEAIRAVQQALEILRGRLPAEPVTISPAPAIPIFDWEQLKRWGLNENRLPAGSIILNRPKTLWSEYKGFVIGGIAVFLAQTLLVIGLLVQRTLRRKAELSVRQRTEELDQFFNVSLDLLGIANTDGYFLRLNPSAERILGYTREELMARRLFEFLHPDDLDRTREAVSTLASQQKVLSFENRYRCKDGKYRWLQWNAVPAGNLSYAAARDVTEQRLSNEALKKAEEKYRSIFEGALEGIFEASGEPMSLMDRPAGEVQTATYNPAMAKMLGYDSVDEIRSFITDPAAQVWVNPDDRAKLGRLMREQQVIRGFECQFWRKDRTKIWVSISGRQICGFDGKTLGYSGFIEDITERKRTAEALRESEKEAQRIAEEALAMAEIGRIISSTLTVEEVYEPFTAVVKKIIPFDRIVINRIDHETNTIKNLYLAGAEIQDREVGKEYSLEGSGNAEMLRTKSTFLLQTEDFKDYKDRFPMLLSTFQAGFRSILNVPLFSQGKIIGGLLLRSFKPYAYADDDVRLAERIGSQIAGAVANAQLFLKKKETEEALRESEERFRQVAENVGDFIWEVDAKGLYRYTSPSVERILGYRPDELIGKKHFYDLFGPEVRVDLKETALRVFAAKESFRAFPNPNLSKEGKVVHLETSGAPVLDAGGNLVGYRGADTDVTERKKAEEEVRRYQGHLEELVEELRKYQEHLEDMVKERTVELMMATNEAKAANQAKSAFLANMSHELRTPLNSILGIGQLMQRDTEFPQKHRQLLGILSRSGQQLFELIDDILEMSRIEAGQANKIQTTFDLHHFLDDLAEMMILRAESKDLQLVFERDEALPQYVQSDERRLRQIMINLLSNAIKFTEKGRVIARARLKEDSKRDGGTEPVSMVRLEFEVEDTGMGIALEDREKIFDPFVQLGAGRRIGEGTGLGLALSRKFAALLGGEITVQSEVGRGSTFKFEIEAQVVDGTGIPSREDSRRVIGITRGQPDYCLLVVDDNMESRLLLRQLLEPVGFRVLEAASGPEAIDLYRKDQPHLVWMDIRMPGMDGYEAARRIREAERGRHTPIIALTAGVMEDPGSSSLSGVFDDWVYKPFREAEVFDKLEKHLRVQFVYRSSVSPAEKPDHPPGKVALAPGDLSRLPGDWLKEFFQTVKKGRSRQLLEQIDGIRTEHADLARVLAEMVRVHQFDQLIALAREALEEKANG